MEKVIFLDIKEVIKILGFSRSKVLNLITAGRLKPVKLFKHSRKLKFFSTDIENFLKAEAIESERRIWDKRHHPELWNRKPKIKEA